MWLCLHSHISIRLIVELCCWEWDVCCPDGVELELGGGDMAVGMALVDESSGGGWVGLDGGLLLGKEGLGWQGEGERHGEWRGVPRP